MVAYASAASGARSKMFGLAASLAMVFAPGLATPSWAESEDAAAARVTAGCVKYKDPASHAQCIYDALGRATEAMKLDTANQRRRAAAAEKRGVVADRQGVEADKRGAEADARGAAADQSIAKSEKVIETASAAKSCYDTIMQEVVAAKKVAPLTPDQKLAFRARMAGCDKS